MNDQAQTLDQLLRDIHAAPDPGWWPPAPGWWMLSLLALLIVAWLVRRLVDRWREHRRRLRIREEYEGIVSQYHANGDLRQLLARSSALLKRVALSSYPRGEVASLSGQAWATFLVETTAGTISKEFAEALSVGPYQPSPSAAPDQIIVAVRDSLKVLVHD